jgi:[ribosomal protein S5]-alanine N-acetyltransferase
MAFGDAFKNFPVLQTCRLMLTELAAQDAADYHRQQRSAMDMPDRPPWTFGFETESVEKARKSFEFAHSAWKKKAKIAWGLRLRAEENALIGCCTFYDFQNQAAAECGFWLGADYHNQGLMTEAMIAAVGYLFETMGLHRVHAYTAVENLQSIAMLKKVGFRAEGTLRQHAKRDTDRWGDTMLMAVLKGELADPAG